jgi:RHS repeat-associated protein
MRSQEFWKALAGLIYLLQVIAVFAPAAMAQTVLATGTITQQVTVNLTGQAGSAQGTISPIGDVSASTASNTAKFTILAGAPPFVGNTFQARFPLTDDCSVTGTIIGGTGLFANSSGSLNLTGSPCLITPDVSTFQISGSGSVTLSFTVDDTCGRDSGGVSQSLCQNQAVSIDPPIVGTPFELNYQSERVPGRNGTSAFLTAFTRDLGGWSLNVRHAFDPVSGNLYLGSGRRRRGAVLGTPPIVNGNYLVTSEDGGEVYVFDNTGRHLSTQDALTGANEYQFAYDSNGNLKTVSDSGGNVTTFARDANGELTSIVGPYGQKTTITVSPDGYIGQITNPNQESIELRYASGGLVTSMTDAQGNTDRFQYDSNGLLTHADHASGASEDLIANSSDGSIKLATAAGVTTIYATDLSSPGQESHNVTYATGLQGNMQSSAGSRSASQPDGTSLQTTFIPDPRWGIQAPVTATAMATTPGNQSMSTESRSVTLSNAADPFSASSITDTVTINGRAFTTTYNAATRTVSTVTPLGRTGATTLDANGRTISQQAGNLDPAAFNYDAYGRLSRVVSGNGATAPTTLFTYNNLGYLSSVTDSVQRVFGFEYDGAGRITKQSMPQGSSILYSYDALGNLTALTPPGKGAHTITYGSGGQLAKYSPPAINGVNGEVSFSYNADGRLTHLLRGGQTIDIGYDNAGRPSTVNLPNASVVYAYDSSTGSLASISGPSDVGLSLAHDGSLLTKETWTGPVFGTVSKTYDANFFVVERTVNDTSISYQLDSDGLVGQAGTLSIFRDPLTGLTTGTSIDNVADAITYDTLGQRSSYSASVNGSPLFSAQYTRDTLGRLIQKTEMVQGVTNTYAYTYDLAGQLTAVVENGSTSRSYSYDANGNRVSFNGPNGTVNGQYDVQDRLAGYGSFKYTYLDNGQLLSATDGQTTTNYQYDALWHLLGVTLADGTQIDYLLDGRGRRVGKKVNGTLVRGWLYQDRLRPLAELDGANNVVSVFIYASRSGPPEYMMRGGNTYRIISDELGSPRLVVDTVNGAMMQALDYDEYGRVLQDTNPGFQPFGFAGGLYDPDTGLAHFGARDYDSIAGRWTGKDPILFGGGQTNLYAYVSNDPVNMIDRRGLQSCVCEQPGIQLNANSVKFSLVGGADPFSGPNPFLTTLLSYLNALARFKLLLTTPQITILPSEPLPKLPGEDPWDGPTISTNWDQLEILGVRHHGYKGPLGCWQALKDYGSITKQPRNYPNSEDFDPGGKFNPLGADIEVEIGEDVVTEFVAP